MGYLKFIELDNFKSYKGAVRIGPFKPFTAIIGPNGSGKSNLMDAISFVLGESTKNMRVKKLSELIHGAPIGQPVSNRASVSFTYSYKQLGEDGDANGNDSDGSESSSEAEIGREIKFTRTVIGSSSEYRIDGRVVNAIDYQNELEKIGIYLKAKNFLVYQGQVESVATKNPKELTQMFEEISRSIELKEEYDRLKAEMDKAEQETQVNFQKKRGVAAQKKEARMEKEEAEKYEKMSKELRDNELQMRLFQLYHNEQSVKQIKRELDERQGEMRTFEKRRDETDARIKEKKKEQGVETREITKIEEQIKDLELRLAKKKPQFIKAKESSSHAHKKMETSRMGHEQALKNHQARQEEIKRLESELKSLEKEKSDFEKEIEREALSQGKSIELHQTQTREYQKLKEQAAKKNAELQEKIDNLQREQKSDQDALDNESRKRNDFAAKQKQKEAEIEEHRVRLTKQIEYIESTEKQIEELRQQEAQMTTEVESAKESTSKLEADLAGVLGKLGDAKIDKFESSRAAKKNEVIDMLKKKFPGVLGRLVDHCQPVSRKYNVAITKVMAKSMDAIVVDTERTAQECIQFMKEHHLPSETFYPLDYIDAPQLDERLREIKEPRNTKLVFDVIKYHPPQIKKALLFSVGNCLVCETDEDARFLAFGNKQQRHKVVSNEGTLFNKTGMISGGSAELKQKARRWDEKNVEELRKEKENLSEKLKENIKVRRREPELNDLRATIKSLEHRVKYNKQTKDQEEKKIQELERELAQMLKSNEGQDDRLKEIEKKMHARLQDLKKVKDESNKVEDEIFKDFCKEIGVKNIRVYEDKELAGQEERVKKRMAFQERRSRITTQLEFEKSRDTERKLDMFQRELSSFEKESNKLKKEEDQIEKDIKSLESEIAKKQTDIEEYKSRASVIENDILELKKTLFTQNKDISDCRKRMTSIEARLLDKNLERHAILKQAKIDMIKLPMLIGTMDDISEEDTLPSQTQSSNTINNTNGMDTESLRTVSSTDQSVLFEKEARIKIDYQKMDNELKNIKKSEDVDTKEAALLSRLNELREVLQNFQAPNRKLDEKIDEVNEIWENTAAEFDKARQQAKKARAQFLKVKQERYDRFVKCFEHINSRIDEIYKSLCMNPGAQATLVLENVEEPYTEGIIYNCVAPGKRFRQMDNLSGGEKTVAALALLFAIRSFNPSPFFVLDEVDAALDNTNIGKVAHFITEQAERGLQCIVISLKEEFFHHADALIGVYPIADECIQSQILSLDLTAAVEE